MESNWVAYFGLDQLQRALQDPKTEEKEPGARGQEPRENIASAKALRLETALWV